MNRRGASLAKRVSWQAGITLALLLSTRGLATAAIPFLDLEGGAVRCGYNDVQIPGDTGTAFSLTDDLSAEGAAFWRVRVGLRLAERHELSALAAPLSLDASGRAPGALDFAGATFPASTPLEAVYRFDSYRLGYRYLLRDTERLSFWLGFTAKIRDAEIAVRSPSLRAKKTDTGFVPLLSLRLDWRLGERQFLTLDGDALAGGPGRAEDVFLGLVRRLGERLTLRAGYRVVEGGADVDAVYNFARLDYASLGLRLEL